MAYTAIENMRHVNRSIYGADTGPLQPSLYQTGKGNDLKSAALRFIHDRCEGLRFDAETDQREQTKIHFGKAAIYFQPDEGF